MIDFENIPFVQARWYTQINERNPRHITLIVLHSMEAPEKGTTAESCANYFHTMEREASAHYCVDNDSIIQCVQTKDVAYGAPNANANGIHIEMAGYAKQTRQEWLDDYGRALLRNVAGLCVKVLMPKYGIPPVELGPEALKLMKAHPERDIKGFTTHADITVAFNPGGHTDPGKGFPIDYFFGCLKEAKNQV